MNFDKESKNEGKINFRGGGGGGGGGGGRGGEGKGSRGIPTEKTKKQ